MKKFLLILSFAVILIYTSSCKCDCEGNDYDGDDYRVTIVEKWSDFGKAYGYDAVITKYHMAIKYTNISDSANVWVIKMLEVTGNIYYSYDKGKTYIFKADKYNEEVFDLAGSYKKIIEQKNAKITEEKENKEKLKKRVI